MKRIWHRYHKNRKIEDRDELIVGHLHLVKFVVGRLGSTLPNHVKLDDLYSSGVQGLVKAVEKFDPTRKTKFQSYATLLIKGAIIDELRELDWTPRSVHQKANLIGQTCEKLAQKMGREPTDTEVAEAMGLELEQYLDLLDKVRPTIFIPLNADGHSQDEEAIAMEEKIADASAKTSREVAQRKERGKLIEKEIKKLSEQERKVLTLYYYEDLMLKEIGEVLGVSESRVSQIHTKALLKLRSRMKEDIHFKL